MKNKTVAFFCLLNLLTAGLFAQSSTDFTRYVNPFVGTAHCRWFHFTPGASPFGMAKPAPSTNGHYGNPSGWEAVGYDYRHTSIEGFPNFHEFQVGGISLMPTAGRLITTPGVLEDSVSGYRSYFTHKDEFATAGYYSVLLKRYGIKTELTSTSRVAFQRYTFPATSDAHILFDIGNKQGESGPVKDAKVYMTSDGRIEGYVITLPAYVQKYQNGAEVAMYFSAVVDKKPTSFGTFKKDMQNAGQKSIEGEGAGLYLTFSTKQNEAITVKLGLSYTSIENARQNLLAEAATLTFDKAKQNTRNKWNEYLGRITVDGKSAIDKEKFYTGLYHAVAGRGLASDVNGAYPKNDGTVGQIALGKNRKPLHNHYNTDAIWGAFWNLLPLWSLAYPEYYEDWVQSQLLVYKDAGWLGDGIACSKYVSGVGTNFTGLAIASAYNYGLRNFDVKSGYEAALKNETGWQNRIEGAGKMDVKQFVDKGYSPYVSELGFDTKSNGSGFGASHTMEYSFSAYAVAQFAKALGKTKDYEQLMQLSNGWKQLYDPETKYIRPKDASGAFISNFNPSEPWKGFQEGNAGNYTFYVPHDPATLIGMMGSDEFNKRLDKIFTASQKNIFGGGTTIDAFAGLAAEYNQGNQPSLHMAWLFNYSGKPYLTQKWVRAVCNEFYGTDGIHGYGYGQDEDQGQLGAWYVLSSIGLFDVQGGAMAKPQMQLASSLFDKVTIKLNKKYYKGDKIEIVTHNNSATNMYMRDVKFNGKPVAGTYVSFDQLTRGGRLEYDLGATPATNK